MEIIRSYKKAEALLARRAMAEAPETEKREATVQKIIDEVKRRGDAALIEYTQTFDKVELTRLEVKKAELKRAYDRLEGGLRDALNLAARRIRAFHRRQQKSLVRNSPKNAGLGWRMRPLERIGVYAPGFQAPLPSTLLMTAIPARVAGVKEIILMTPPQRETRKPAAVTLAAAYIAGTDRVFAVGGAQAIAALAYGTASVPRVDKVCGPGNMYVTLAKKLVSGDVGIDGLYGPSEVIIIADETANPVYIAADLLAQAEHGNLPTAILITTSAKLADTVRSEIDKQVKELARRDVVAESLEQRGMIVIVDKIDEALELANQYAPEHLCLVIKGAESYVDKVKNAGCLFLGENSIEVLVDYVAGPSHVLPTGGTARFGSPLNILDFVKLISVVNTNEKDVQRLSKAASVIARAEGLSAHARAAEIRLEEINRGGK